MELHALNYIIRTREVFIELLEGLTLEDINQIPAGFRNNIGWNFGHIVISTQALCYLRTGLVTTEDAVPFYQGYKKGSKPTYWIEADELASLKEQAFTSIQKIEEDRRAGFFAAMKPFATATYGYEMPHIDEVITCTLAHDNLHLGYAMAIKRALEGTRQKIVT